MSRGRCAGCGLEDASCKKVKAHVQTCPQYLEVFRTDPERALDPEREYVRAREERMSERALDAKEEQKAETHQAFRAAQARRVEEAADRWSGKVRTRFASSAGRETQVGVPDGVPLPVVQDSPTGRFLAEVFVTGGGS